MEPKEYERLATFEELDREYTESDRAQADSLEETVVGEFGGELGRADWEDAVSQS